MDKIYLISLIVGGFFVLLSIFGGGEHDTEADHDLSFDADHDMDLDLDSDMDAGHEFHLGVDSEAGPGFVDLLSIRALFLFAAFFGLTGVILGAVGTVEPLNAILSATTGLAVGLGGNWVIKRFAYEHVSSQVTSQQLTGRTARVVLPIDSEASGRIMLEAGGKKIQLTAQLFDAEAQAALEKDEEVVVYRMDGRIAKVIRPD